MDKRHGGRFCVPSRLLASRGIPVDFGGVGDGNSVAVVPGHDTGGQGAGSLVLRAGGNPFLASGVGCGLLGVFGAFGFIMG
jgi:hypothetical protein